MMGNEEEALKYYDRVLNINPSHASALNDKGISLTSKAKTKEEFENALSYFDRALSANPNYFEALINKGACMLKFKKNEEDFQEMLILLNKALSIRRNDSGVLRNMGITYNLWKRFDKSLECFDKILELEPKNTEILLFKAETLLKVEPEKSIEWFDKVLALEPNNERAEEGKRNALSI